VNREEIQQVTLNLILNAEQAMKAHRGSGRLEVRTAATDGGVQVEVQDDGPGIPAVLAGRVFEPFFSTKGVGQGTGLGLSIALGIAEAHGGSLSLQQTGRGACFRMVLPAATATPSSAAVTTAPSETRRPATGHRALVADDERALRELLQRFLTKRGFSVDVAEHGQAALALVEHNDYDVIFCDVSMPRMGGLAVYAQLRASHPQLARRFVLITGDTLDSRLTSAAERANIPVLAKPFSTATVDAVVDRLIGGNPSMRTAPGKADATLISNLEASSTH